MQLLSAPLNDQMKLATLLSFRGAELHEKGCWLQMDFVVQTCAGNSPTGATKQPFAKHQHVSVLQSPSVTNTLSHAAPLSPPK